ncbi:Arginine N-methyltransferase 1 [Caligus rogercresseyi]|uniref:Arginine N-methyltransferase 1 n=1 Tax=Caligus rogercresseyi TaxID=217165 RepID=A0A7T8GTA6_CALRO|nr:Arginine N-methyltransferase 1 [Caligus rogercresseyi]
MRHPNESLFPLLSLGPCDVFQYRVHQVSQAHWFLHRTRGTLHALEANRFLPTGLHHLQERRRALWRVLHATQRSEQAGHGL